MKTPCHTCEHTITFWSDVSYDTDNRTFCSLKCVYKYRGRRKLA